MAGYYDEITGQFVETGDVGVLPGPLDNTSGTSGNSFLFNLADTAKRMLSGQGTGSEYGNLAAGLAGLYAASQSSAPTIYNPGYSGGIPEVKAAREMLTAPPAGRRPGSTGINYGGDVTYTPTGKKLGGDNIGASTAGAGVTGADRNVAANWGVAESLGSYLPMYDLIKNYSEADLKSKFGLSDADIKYLYSRPGIAAGTRPPEIMQAWAQAEQTKDYAPLETITRTFTPEQLQDQFKLSGADLDYIYSRPGTGVSTATDEDLMEAWAQAEKTGNYAGLSALLKGQTPESLKSRFGLSDADIQYIYSRPGVSRLRKGGLAADGFVVPADVVSHFGNGSSEAGLEFLAQELGAKPIKGEGDGMSDSIPTTIDGKQPARVANDEAFISPEMVKRLGGGNTERGAKKLYAMMDRIRKARTGTTEQGKEINPEKFMPGGKVDRYQTGGTTTTSGGSSLAEWAGPYVADMLGKGKALSEMPYQAYTGQLTAGASPLQEQAFGIAGALKTPAAIGQAAQTAGGLASTLGQLGYTPATFGSQFAAPGAYQAMQMPSYSALSAQNVGSTFQAPAAYQTGVFGNQFAAPGTYQSMETPSYSALSAQNVGSTFTAPSAYQAMETPGYSPLAVQGVSSTFQAPQAYQTGTFTNQFAAPTGAYTPGTFDTEMFGTEQAQRYMSPFVQQALTPQLREAQRQAEITRAADAARMAKAGAFGGSRQAIMESEAQRNLLNRLSDITGTGYATAYDKAQQAFTQDQARRLQAQQAAEGAKQFGAGQAMTAAQLAAQYGLSAEQAREASRQFGAQQGLTAATTAGSQALQAALANQQAGLTAGQANINAALEAARMREASRQFGAQQGLTAATTAGSQALQAALANQQAGLTAGQANINAALEASRQREASRQFGAGQGMTAAQLAAQYGLAGQQATEASRQFGAQQGLAAATTAGSQALQAALANQQAGLTAGQANINAALEASRQREASRQFGAGQGMTAAQLAAQYGLAGQQASEASRQFGATYGLQGLQSALQAAQTQGQLGATQQAADINNLRALAEMGATQRGIEAEGVAADKAQFEEARLNPYKMLQFQQSLLQGLPLAAQTVVQPGQSNLQQFAGGFTTIAQLLQSLGLLK